MFYSYELLCLKNKGKFCTPWILATTSKTLTKRDIAKVDVRLSCREVFAMMTTHEQQRSKRFSLYLSAVLIHGLCLVHQRQVDIFYDKLVSAQITMAAVGLDESGNLHPLKRPAERKRKANDPDKTKAKRPKKAKKLVDNEQASLEGDMEALPVCPRRDSHILIEDVAMPASLLSSEKDGFGALIPEFQAMLLNGDDPFQDNAMQTEADVVTNEQHKAGNALDSLSVANKEGPATCEPKDPVSPIERTTLAIKPMAAVIEPTAAVIEPTTSVAEPSVPESAQPAPVLPVITISPASQADVTSPDQRRRHKKKAPKRKFQDKNISFTTQDQKKWFDPLALQRIRREQNWEADMHNLWRQGEHVRTDQLIRLPSIATLAHNLELMFERTTNQSGVISRHLVGSRRADSTSNALVEEPQGSLNLAVQQPIDQQQQPVGELEPSAVVSRVVSSLNQDLPTSETVTAEINSLLEGKEFIFFSDLCPPGKCTRMVAALTFGLLQELHQKGICKVTQENPQEFGQIKIEIT